MSEMLERAAQAIMSAAINRQCSAAIAVLERRDYVAFAEAVIRSMREPEQSVIAAGEAVQQRSAPIYDYHTDDVWRAMIDEILKG